MIMASMTFFISLVTAFCCYVTWRIWNSTNLLHLLNLLIIVAALLLEQFVLRPFVVFLIALYIWLRRRCRKGKRLHVGLEQEELNKSIFSDDDVEAQKEESM